MGYSPKRILLYIILLSFTASGYAQSLLKDSIMPALLFQFNYTSQFPFADMKTRYGSNFGLGGAISYKTKQNIQIGIEGMAIIGENIKDDDPLHGAYTKDGGFIGQDGTFQTWSVHERGFILKGTIGYTIHFKKPNVNSGILLQVGGGMMQHRMKINVDVGQVPQMTTEYQRGYDHLANGGVISQFIGYQYMGVKKRVNLYGGIEFTEGFLKGRRAWNYALNAPDNARQIDVLIGVKVGWIFPRYFKTTEKYYYN